MTRKQGYKNANQCQNLKKFNKYVILLETVSQLQLDQ